jgi:hypothetical protein
MSEKIDLIHNWAPYAGNMVKNRKMKVINKKEKKLDKLTVANILSQFRSISDIKEAAIITMIMMYIRKQIGRKKINIYGMLDSNIF